MQKNEAILETLRFLQFSLQPAHLFFANALLVGVINEDKVAVGKGETVVHSAYILFIVALIPEKERDLMVADVAEDRFFGVLEQLYIGFELRLAAVIGQVTVVDGKEDVTLVELLYDAPEHIVAFAVIPHYDK